MSGGIVGAAEWVFESVLLAVMIATLTYARRLDRLLRQVRSDRDALQILLEQIGVSVTAAVAAADRLKAQSSETSVRIASACAAADQTGRTLEDLIDRAGHAEKPQPLARNRPRSVPRAIERSTVGLEQVQVDWNRESDASSPDSLALQQMRRAFSTDSQRENTLKSRTERDLARMLADAC